MSTIELGCGLIALGRPWGTTAEVPTEEEAFRFLRSAYDSGIRFFDTAPSYGLSEDRLGHFLRTLTPDERAEIVIATKFGEHWDETEGTAYTDHSINALKSSLENSQRRLGRISVLQLHKATPELLSNPDVMHAFDYAADLGITRFGVSASDPDTADAAIADPRISILQLPFNEPSAHSLREVLHRATESGKELLINRPFQMGRVSSESTPENKHRLAVEAFRFILQEEFSGVVLTGTSNARHLQENIEAFNEAKNI